ncbi:MAG: hypothetical protein ACJ72N_01640 [Labedaea sp.]
MSQESISEQELQELSAKLDALDLSPAQRALLRNVLQIAWDLVGSQTALDKEFDGSFKPVEAARILAYLGSPSQHSITRSFGGSSITRSTNP